MKKSIKITIMVLSLLSSVSLFYGVFKLVGLEGIRKEKLERYAEVNRNSEIRPLDDEMIHDIEQRYYYAQTISLIFLGVGGLIISIGFYIRKKRK